MPCEAKTFYESSNGDRWLIARDPASDRVFVQHQANLPSGGHATEIEVSRFLAPDSGGPEHQALRELVLDERSRTGGTGSRSQSRMTLGGKCARVLSG